MSAPITHPNFVLTRCGNILASHYFCVCYWERKVIIYSITSRRERNSKKKTIKSPGSTNCWWRPCESQSSYAEAWGEIILSTKSFKVFRTITIWGQCLFIEIWKCGQRDQWHLRGLASESFHLYFILLHQHYAAALKEIISQTEPFVWALLTSENRNALFWFSRWVSWWFQAFTRGSENHIATTSYKSWQTSASNLGLYVTLLKSNCNGVCTVGKGAHWYVLD